MIFSYGENFGVLPIDLNDPSKELMTLVFETHGFVVPQITCSFTIHNLPLLSDHSDDLVQFWSVQPSDVTTDFC